MKFYVPSVGDKVQLTRDWEFPCFCEYRNNNFIKRMRPDVPTDSHQNGASVTITLPAGTILTVDRIYIRKGKSDWDSITFIMKAPEKTKAKGFSNANRFWAKLIDVNEIEFEKVDRV